MLAVLLAVLLPVLPRRPLAFAARAHGWLTSTLSTRTPRAFSAKMLSSWLAPNLYWVVHGVVPPQAQDFTLPLAELHEVRVCPFLQPVVVPLNGGTTVWYISDSSQSCNIHKLAESVLSPVIQVINEEVKQYWPQY